MQGIDREFASPKPRWAESSISWSCAFSLSPDKSRLVRWKRHGTREGKGRRDEGNAAPGGRDGEVTWALYLGLPVAG